MEEEKDDRDRSPVAPPEGTRRARFHAFTTRHPRVWASRHVVLAVGQVLATVLGIGLVFRWVLPSIPWPDVNWPDIPRPDLPDLTPDWLEEAGAAVREQVLEVLRWAAPVLGTTKYWLPIVIALAVAAREIDRRRRRDQTPPQSGRSGSPET